MTELKGRIHSVETFGTIDGPGIRYVIFFQGCPLKCKYCHNRDSWSVKSGKEMSVSEIVLDIKKYISFMKYSGGGVTISGGEPTLQSPFLKELILAIKKMGIHICLDTSGYTDIYRIGEILDCLDLVILDLKHMDKEKHIELTGVDNEKIILFARYISDKSVNTWIRHVLVPGLTDSPEHMVSMAEFISSLESVSRVELLPYHSIGKYKWDLLGQNYELSRTPEASSQDILKARRAFRLKGIEISFELQNA